MQKGPNWDNHIMRKHGQSIRRNIAEAFGVFARAVITEKREKALREFMENLPEKAWRHS